MEYASHIFLLIHMFEDCAIVKGNVVAQMCANSFTVSFVQSHVVIFGFGNDFPENGWCAVCLSLIEGYHQRKVFLRSSDSRVFPF